MAVARGHAGIGHIFPDQGGEVGQTGHTVGDDIDLSAAAHLEVHGFGNDLVAEGVDFGLDGAAVGRRGLDDAEVAGAREETGEGELGDAVVGGGAKVWP